MDRNKIAALLSVIPGLGHLYKHYYLSGMGIMVAGNALIVFITCLLAFATLGAALVVIPALWVTGIAYSAYMASDEHGMHPWLHVWEYRWHKTQLSDEKA